MAQKISLKQILFFLCLYLIVFSMSACHDDVDNWKSIDGVVVRHNLRTFNGEFELENYAKQAAVAHMRAEVEVNRNSDKYWRNGGEDLVANLAMDESSDSAVTPPTHSVTNTQEAGVDEADVVKTDGNYIYTLSGGELVIVRALDGTMEKSSVLDVGGYANELFIFGDIAVVFSSVPEGSVPTEIHFAIQDYEPASSSNGDMVMPDKEVIADSMMLDCGMRGCYGRSYSQIAIVDVTNRELPAVLKTTLLAAEYVTSRMVNGKVRVVYDTEMENLKTVWDYGLNAQWDTVEGMNAGYENVVRVNEALISELTLDKILPKKWDSVSNEVSYIVNPIDVIAPKTISGVGLQTIVSIDLSAPLSDSLQVGVFSQRGLVYASQESLYLTSARDWVSLAMESGLWQGNENQTTGIHKFGIASESLAITYEATGTVDGRLLDQFCMGEKDGYLRVASTTGDFWWFEEEKNTLNNHVFVLQQNDSKLEQVGHVGNLGKGEEIYAARFVGDRGFLVTFFQTDPLYTLDLSDPTAPVAVGEWVGLGYSTYLHPWGDNLIISIGEQDWRPAISLYDISNYAVPALVQRFFLDDDEWTSALHEHKAVTFNPDTGYLAIPFSSWGQNYQTGIRTFSVSETAIVPVDKLSLIENVQQGAEAEALRSLYIGDYMYGMSRCRLVSAAMATPAETVESMVLFAGDTCTDEYYYYY